MILIMFSFWSHADGKCMKCDEGWLPLMDLCQTDIMLLTIDYWESAQAQCMEMNATLLALDTKRKFEYYLISYRRDFNDFKGIWVNSRTNISKVFKWPNGREVNLSFFGDNHPDDYDGLPGEVNEGCLMLSRNNSYMLNDANCYKRANFICECH